MLVFRFERNGYGPFRFASKGLNNKTFNSDYSYKHPPMYRGNLKENTGCKWGDIYYGCTSLDGLKLWFDFELMQDKGFELKCYYVLDGYYEIGNNQCIFVKRFSYEIKND